MNSRAQKCPECDVLVVNEYYEWHLKHAHNEYYVDEEEYDEEYYEDADDELNADFLQKNIDATKDYGYPCREEGRYGSLSGYDGFDDESEA